jgi:hypothetical protein
VGGSGQWWECDYQLYGDAVYWCHGADGDGCVGEPAGDFDDGGRFDQWDGVYLYGGGHQCGGYRAGVGRFFPGDAGGCSWCAGGSVGGGR